MFTAAKAEALRKGLEGSTGDRSVRSVITPVLTTPIQGGLRRSGTFTPRLKACASDGGDLELDVLLPAALNAIRCLQSSCGASAVQAVLQLCNPLGSCATRC